MFGPPWVGSTGKPRGEGELEATAVRKEGHVSQQDVESDKYLGRILEQVRHDQLARDEETLRTGKATLRQKHRLRLDMLRRVAAPAKETPPPNCPRSVMAKNTLAVTDCPS